MSSMKLSIRLPNFRKIRLPDLSKIRIPLDNDALAQYALFMFLCTDAIRQIFSDLLGNPTVSIYIAIFLIYAPVVWMIKNKGIRGLKVMDFVVLWLMIAIAFGASYLLYPENAYYFTRPTYGVLYRVLRADRPIYGYLFVRLLNDKKKILKTLKIASYFLMVYYIITLVNALRLGYWLEYNGAAQLVRRSYSLVFGYNCVLPTIVFLFFGITEKKAWYFVMSVIGFGCIVMGGSRGALICVGAFILCFTIQNIGKLVKNYWFLSACLIAAVLLCLLATVDVGSLLISLLKNSGIESRTIEKLVEGTISDENGRDIIWKMAAKMIREGGFFGYGLYGDRPVISSFHYAGYCHDIFLELLVNFGVPIGSLLIALMLYASGKMLFFCKDDDWRNLFLIFFACSCELILSMSLWYVNYFWLAFGIGMCYYKERRKRRHGGMTDVR